MRPFVLEMPLRMCGRGEQAPPGTRLARPATSRMAEASSVATDGQARRIRVFSNFLAVCQFVREAAWICDAVVGAAIWPIARGDASRREPLSSNSLILLSRH